MNVVLSILQIIGWIFLIVVLVTFLAVMLVLFLPIRYEIDGECLEEKWAKAKASWFLRLFRARVSYGDDLIYAEVGILWKRFTFSYDLTSREEDGEEKEKSVQTKETQTESIISKIKGMIERIKEIYPKVKKMLTDEMNQEAVVHLKNEVLYLIKILLPKKSKVDAIFSTGSPDTTGQLFGVLAMFPVMYQKDWSLLPDFESDDAYFKGTFWGKGRVFGYQLLGIVLRILFDKKCMRLYTIINQFIKLVKRESVQEEKIDG